MSKASNTGSLLEINSIREIYFSVNDELYVPDPNKLIKIELYHQMGVHEESKTINFMLGTYIHYAGSHDRLADLKTNNVFRLPRLNDYKGENDDYTIPVPILLLIAGESIAHARALFAKNLAGTPYEQIIIPLGDPMQVVENFFPALLKNKKGAIGLQGKIGQPLKR